MNLENYLQLVKGGTTYEYALVDARAFGMTSEPDLKDPTQLGMPTQAMQAAVWPLTIRDLSGGLGTRVLFGREDINDFWYNYGWDTAYPNRLQLWPECTLLTTITATDAPPSHNGRMGAVVVAKLGTAETYSVSVQYGDRIVEITDPTAASPTVTERLNHTEALVNLQLFTDQSSSIFKAYLLTADASGTSSSWLRSADGTTYNVWSPAIGVTDPENDNPFICSGSQGQTINWIRSPAATNDWIIESKGTPDTSGATGIADWSNTNLRPRFLGVDIGGTARYIVAAARKLAGLYHDTALEPNYLTGFMSRNVYSYRNMLLFENVGTDTNLTPEGAGVQYVSNRGALGIGGLVGGRRGLGGAVATARISDTYDMNRGQGLHANYIGHIGPMASRPDALFFLMEISSSEVLDRNPDGTQTTWLMEARVNPDGKSISGVHPIARKPGAMLDFGLAVTTDTVYFATKTSSTTVDVWRVKRGVSPGERGVDNFEGFTPYAAQCTAANSEYLSIADNAALSMGDIDMSGGAWVYHDSLPTAGNTMGILGKWAAGNLEYVLFTDNTGGTVRFKFSVRDTADTTTTTVTATTFGTPAISTWYFVQFYHDATANTIGIAVNNGAFDTAATSGGIRNGTAAFEIGRHTAGNYFNGRIDAPFITKEVLSSSEWSYLYSNGTGQGYDSVYDGLRTAMTAWWNMDESSSTRRDSKGANHLTDNNTVTQAAGLTGNLARLTLPWMDFGWPQDAGTAFYVRSLQGTFTNMSLRVKYQLNHDETTDYTLGTLTAAGTLSFTANTTFTAIRLILEGWRSTGTTATDTLVLTGGAEFGYRKSPPARRQFVADIDLDETRRLREAGGTAVGRGALLSELHGFTNSMVNVVYDETTYSSFFVEKIIEKVVVDDPARTRRGEYRILAREVA